MLVEPPVDRSTLTDAVLQYYGLTVSSLEYVPVGWATAGYSVWADGSQYFLKLWPDRERATGALERLPFVQELHAHGLRVPYPLATKTDELWVEVPTGVIALFPFLIGEILPDWPVWPRSVLREIGRTVGQLHSIPLELPFREEFEMKTREQLRPYYGGEVLRPYETELAAQLDRLDELQAAARAVPSRFVVSHTDLYGNNMLVDGDGHVSVLDWDDMRLAPPEYDLSLLLHGVQPMDASAFLTVLEVYPIRPLRLELFAFFLLRRALNDFTARVVVLADPDLSAAAVADAREGLEVWGAEQWRHLDRLLGLIRAPLAG
ncbi:phosphotransferase enzyme family protein [Kribbella monticola]|uniref:phosphotransferase enzyme family protein n=1 Tax=Kribbella monticola TaxID=2185285 RepID=UPI000DD4D2DC|nr:aminoglycoside phosphotransferase family protein [Kribbella monticola]